MSDQRFKVSSRNTGRACDWSGCAILETWRHARDRRPHAERSSWRRGATGQGAPWPPGRVPPGARVGAGRVGAVAAVAVATGASIGVLPMGTLNHFAKDVGLPLKLEEAVNAIVA